MIVVNLANMFYSVTHYIFIKSVKNCFFLSSINDVEAHILTHTTV